MVSKRIKKSARHLGKLGGRPKVKTEQASQAIWIKHANSMFKKD